MEKFQKSAVFLSLALMLFASCKQAAECREGDFSCSLGLLALSFSKATVPRFVYLTSTGGGIHQYRLNKDTGTLTPLGMAASAGNAFQLVVDATGTFAVLNCDLTNTVQAFSIDSSTGQLTLTHSQSSGVLTPWPVAIDSARRVVHVPMNGGSNITSYRISTSGGLTSLGSVPTAASLQGLTMHPGGEFVFAAATGLAYAFRINADGTLTQSGSAVAGNGATQPVVTPDGRSVYVSNNTTGNVSAYSFNAASGSLTLIETKPVVNAIRGVVNSAGTILAVPDNIAAATLYTFAIQANGSLVSSGTLAFGTNGSNQVPAFAPAHDIVYFPLPVLGVLSMTAVSATGAPSQIAQIPSIGGLAYPVVDPSGKFVFVPSPGTNQLATFRVLSSGQVSTLETLSATGATQAAVASYLQF